MSAVPGRRLLRTERFTFFQKLTDELKAAGTQAAPILTRLYNGLTTELTKAEAEITQLENANNALQLRLETARAAAQAAEQAVSYSATLCLQLVLTPL